jgi:capsid protein
MNAAIAAAGLHNPYFLWLKEQKSANLERDFQQQYREYQASYFVGSTSRFLPMPTGIKSLGSDADWHYGSEQAYFLGIERARFEDRENMVFGQGVNRLVSNVIPSPFSHDSLAPDDALADDLHAGWAAYAADKKQCDYEQERDLDTITEMSLRNMIIDGDIYHLLLENGQIQTMESHKNRTPWSIRKQSGSNGPAIVHGVELQDGKRVAYHFTASNLNPLLNSRYNTRRVETYNEGGVQQVLHVYNPKRFTQRRGITTLAPIVFPTKYHDDLQFAALVNAKRQSFIATIHEFDLGSDPDDPENNNNVRPYISGVTGQQFEGGSCGTRVKGVPGERIKPWTTNVPGHSHFQHAELLMTIMSVNLDLPMMVFFLDASKGNFSNYRGVMQQAYRRFRFFQRNLRKQLHTPAYLHYAWRRIGSEPAMYHAYKKHGQAMFKHQFTPPRYEYIQPLQDAAADDMRLTRNLISGRRWCLENLNTDWWTLADEITQDRATLIEAAMNRAVELNKKFGKLGQKVNWREIAYGQSKSGTQVSLSGAVPDKSLE